MSWHELQSQPIIFWVVATFSVYLTGISKSGFAGGPGVLAMPMLSLIMDPKLAAAMLLPVLIFMDMLNVRIYKRDVDIALLKPLIAGSITGIVLGAFCFTLFNALHIKLMVGCIALWFSLSNLMPHASRPTRVRHTALAATAAGGVSGFTSFIAHAGGPPLSGYLLGLNIDKLTYLGTATIFFTLTNLIKLPGYAAVGQLSLNVGVFLLLMTPVGWLGIKSGVKLKDLLPDHTYRRVMNCGLLILGLYLIGDSGLELLRY